MKANEGQEEQERGPIMFASKLGGTHGFRVLGPETRANIRWVVVKIIVPFWVPNIIRHLLQNGTLILTTTQVLGGSFLVSSISLT